MFYRIKSCLSGISVFFVFVTIMITLIPNNICKGEELWSTVVVVYSNKYFTEKNNGASDLSLLPLRKIVEPMGVVVKWDPDPIQGSKNVTVFSLTIGSKQVSFNRGRPDNKVFFLEQPPIIENGRTMVPYGFIREIARATANPERNLKMLATITDLTLKSGDQLTNEYKYYDLLTGNPYGPSFEKAQVYVIENGLLKSVKRTTYSPLRNDTMVTGSDENGREKIVWLGANMYTGEIYMTGSTYTDQGIKREIISEKLRLKGFVDEESITTIAVLPNRWGKICWFIEVNNGSKRTILFYDFYTGELIEEWLNGAIVKP